MSAIFFPNVGEIIIATDALANDSGWIVELYQNDHTPSDGDTESDYTVADFSGYSSGSLSKDGSVFINGSGKAQQDYSPIEYIASGGDSNDIYGFYITDSVGSLIAASRFDSAPITVGDGGQSQINVTPSITIVNEV